MLIEAFGFLSVSAMVTFYALESRAPVYVLAFAGSCLSAACYATLIGSWPFAAVETLWSVVAFNRWRHLATTSPERTA
ncbi:MAG: hypothetical protein AAF961_02200 [Planctomycetota bacterium]